MGYLAYKASDGLQEFKGAQYVNPEKGTHKICLRTGLGTNDVVKYGLTTNAEASEYCGIKFKVSGMEARIGRYGGSSSSETKSITSSSRQYYSASTYSARGNYTYTTQQTKSGTLARSFHSSSTLYSTRVENGINISESLSVQISKQYETLYTYRQSYTSYSRSYVSYMRYTTTSRMSVTSEQNNEDNFNL